MNLEVLCCSPRLFVRRLICANISDYVVKSVDVSPLHGGSLIFHNCMLRTVIFLSLRLHFLKFYLISVFAHYSCSLSTV